jgi:hypothetical protein
LGFPPTNGPFLDAAFTIFSSTPNAVVIGTKSARTGSGRALCEEDGEARFVAPGSQQIVAAAQYSATIQTSAGRFHDEGTAPLSFLHSFARVLDNALEVFTSSLAAPIPIGGGDD